MDLSTILQVLTLIVAAAGPALAYIYARRLALSANRQAWLDGLRNDISELIAVKDGLSLLFQQQEDGQERRRVAREMATQMQSARFRVRLRLRAGNPQHDQLISSISSFIAAKDGDERRKTRKVVEEDAQRVIQAVWRVIEAGR